MGRWNRSVSRHGKIFVHVLPSDDQVFTNSRVLLEEQSKGIVVVHASEVHTITRGRSAAMAKQAAFYQSASGFELEYGGFEVMN